MITEEQIKKLKPGDPLVIHCEYIKHHSSGDIVIKCNMTRGGELSTDNKYVHRSCVSLPSEYKSVVDARDVFGNMSESEKASISNFLASYFRESKKQEEMRNALKKMGISLTPEKPKHDPCRPFRAGDIVAPRVVNGRTDIDLSGCCRFTVMQDESPRHHVPVKSWLTKNKTTTHAVYLELVTPVEELEQYRVVDAYTHFDVADKYMKTVVSYSKVHHPNAKDAAEAERDRLNAEYRKEQK